VDASRGLFTSFAGILLGFGLIMVHSASITSWPTAFERVYLSRHAAFLLVAVCSSCLCAVLPARFWWKASPYLFVLTAALLILVLVPGVGTQVNGARRWLRAGGISLQPSEVAKLALPLFMGRLLVGHRQWISHWFYGTVPFLAPLVLIVSLVFLEPDLGTAVFLVVMGGLLLWLAGWPIRNYIIVLTLLGPCAGLFLSIKPYQLERLKGFVATWEDVNHAPYQIRQSLMSLGAGGIDGVGVGKGWQKLSFLPEANTDFVFSVVGEELGLLGTICLVVIWAGFFLSGYAILRRHDRSSYQYLVGMVLLIQLVLQAAVNTAVVTAVMPPKGISHPFLSYGGSNLVVSLAAVGIILSFASASKSQEGHPQDIA
jgi:cell division protein FtsW